jgi:Histidine kinase-, DNA gyrase B-, and HSP90-like ATPase
MRATAAYLNRRKGGTGRFQSRPLTRPEKVSGSLSGLAAQPCTPKRQRTSNSGAVGLTSRCSVSNLGGYRAGAPVGDGAGCLKEPNGEIVGFVRLQGRDLVYKYSRILVVVSRFSDVGIAVEDTGNGFNVDEARRTRGLGLISMEERVRLVNGTFDVRSQPEQGTTVDVFVPLE